MSGHRCQVMQVDFKAQRENLKIKRSVVKVWGKWVGSTVNGKVIVGVTSVFCFY